MSPPDLFSPMEITRLQGFKENIFHRYQNFLSDYIIGFPPHRFRLFGAGFEKLLAVWMGFIPLEIDESSLVIDEIYWWVDIMPKFQLGASPCLKGPAFRTKVSASTPVPHLPNATMFHLLNAGNRIIKNINIIVGEFEEFPLQVPWYEYCVANKYISNKYINKYISNGIKGILHLSRYSFDALKDNYSKK